MIMEDKFARWNGVDLSTIEWNPKIDEKKCTGCGMCITSYGRNVFDFEEGKKKSVVARPNNCMVG